ncbi:MAG: hypothetical protein P4L64_03675 [Caulobacteraceae bacterium]|nr:hypothetical protein [Caulobacteraceae bacterium]
MKIVAWYLRGLDFESAPSSLSLLSIQAQRLEIHRSSLVAAGKWEHLLKGDTAELPKGWTHLEQLARTRRGIATGANAFFLISSKSAQDAGIREEMLLPCVGRASDVEHLVFSNKDFQCLDEKQGKTRLINFHGELTSKEREYVKMGERSGLTNRYLLANRSPWYSMEQREIAPIWATVFGRGDLKFVYNEAGSRSLTNFHCIYPIIENPIFSRAITFCLNSPSIRRHSKLHMRAYGGGLSKFEPNDLKSIPLPDLRNVSSTTLGRLSEGLLKADSCARSGKNYYETIEAEKLIESASIEAHNAGQTELI